MSLLWLQITKTKQLTLYWMGRVCHYLILEQYWPGMYSCPSLQTMLLVSRSMKHLDLTVWIVLLKNVFFKTSSIRGNMFLLIARQITGTVIYTDQPVTSFTAVAEWCIYTIYLQCIQKVFTHFLHFVMLKFKNKIPHQSYHQYPIANPSRILEIFANFLKKKNWNITLTLGPSGSWSSL